MNVYIKRIFKDKKIDREKLLSFGFIKDGGELIYKKEIADGEMLLTLKFVGNGEFYSKVTDKATGEEYTLFLVEDAVGAFVGKVRADYIATLKSIAKNCSEKDYIKGETFRKLVEYAKNTYGDELEYLWEKFPNNAIIRRAENRKWYAVFISLPKNKLGDFSDETVEIVCLRIPPEKVLSTVDNKRFFTAYHMNKKNWITALLDGSIDIKDLEKLLGGSYLLAAKKR